MADTDVSMDAAPPAPASPAKVDEPSTTAAASASTSTSAEAKPSDVKPAKAGAATKADDDFDVLAGLDDDQIDLKIARQGACASGRVYADAGSRLLPR